VGKIKPINEQSEGPTVAISIDLLTKLTADSRRLDALLDPDGAYTVLRGIVYFQMGAVVTTRVQIDEVLGRKEDGDE
jgi:hypothetical protein